MEQLPAAVTWGRLQTFLAVYDGGSVRAAAQALHVTPPAVSAAVMALETALGESLFVKSGRGIVATAAGDTFAGYARSLVGLLAEAAGAVRAPEAGRLRVGAVATAAEFVLPELVASFSTAHPLVELSLQVSPRAELFARAARHELDLVLAGRPPRDSPLRPRARRPNRLVVVGAPGVTGSPLDQPWLLTAAGSGTRDTALALLARAQASPRTLVVGSIGAALAMARHRLGLTLAHEPAVRADLDTGSLVTYPVTGTPLARPWLISTPPAPTASVRLFLQHVSDPAAVGVAAFTRV